MIAKLHNFAEQWRPDFPLERLSYDGANLNKIARIIGDGVVAGLFSADQYRVIQEGVNRITDLMDELDTQPDSFGLIHADLAVSNLIVNGETITPIDFAMSGYGYFMQDLGDLSSSFGPLHIRKAMLDGYDTIRRLSTSDLKYVEAFFVSGILYFMAIHLHSGVHREWFMRRVPVICERYIEPLVRDQRFYDDI
ncbi:MAG TPA: phosphotransferase [Firmicutes bacterium]|nr:phosphotransferase [Bacillota bacterium]